MSRFDQQSRESDDVRLMFLNGIDELSRWNLDSQIDDIEAIVGEDDLHQILSDVMNVTLDGRQHHFPPRDGIR